MPEIERTILDGPLAVDGEITSLPLSTILFVVREGAKLDTMRQSDYRAWENHEAARTRGVCYPIG